MRGTLCRCVEDEVQEQEVVSYKKFDFRRGFNDPSYRGTNNLEPFKIVGPAIGASIDSLPFLCTTSCGIEVVL